MSKAIPISTDLMEAIAFEGHLTIEVRGNVALLTMPSGRRFTAALPSIPEQREPGADE